MLVGGPAREMFAQLEFLFISFQPKSISIKNNPDCKTRPGTFLVAQIDSVGWLKPIYHYKAYLNKIQHSPD